MGDLSLHFSRAEFACHGRNCCGGVSPVCDRLIQALEHLRGLAVSYRPDRDIKFLVSSGFRCATHNALIKGNPSSFHLFGMAADIVPCGISVVTLSSLCKHVPDFASGGIGVYTYFIHLDVRTNGPARW
jgi:uncharacterized protein YcbK (DUF882 family)